MILDIWKSDLKYLISICNLFFLLNSIGLYVISITYLSLGATLLFALKVHFYNIQLYFE